MGQALPLTGVLAHSHAAAPQPIGQAAQTPGHLFWTAQTLISIEWMYLFDISEGYLSPWQVEMQLRRPMSQKVNYWTFPRQAENDLTDFP